MNCIITRSGGGSSSRMPQFTYTGQYEFITEDEAAKSWKLKLLSSGVFTLLSPRELDIDLFLVGGGGAGGGEGSSGGGGGGYTATHKNISIQKNTPYPVAVGAGGVANTSVGTAGGISSGFTFSVNGGQPGAEQRQEWGSSLSYNYRGSGGNGGSGGGGGGSGEYQNMSGTYGGDGGNGGSDGSGGTAGGDGSNRHGGSDTYRNYGGGGGTGVTGHAKRN